MTKESKTFIKKYWQAIVIFSTCQLLIVFFGNMASYELREYKVHQLELKINKFISDFNEELKPNLSILFWMHGLDTRGEDANNNHDHKN